MVEELQSNKKVQKNNLSLSIRQAQTSALKSQSKVMMENLTKISRLTPMTRLNNQKRMFLGKSKKSRKKPRLHN